MISPITANSTQKPPPGVMRATVLPGGVAAVETRPIAAMSDARQSVAMTSRATALARNRVATAVRTRKTVRMITEGWGRSCVSSIGLPAAMRFAFT